MNSSMRTFIPPAGLATPTRIRKLILGANSATVTIYGNPLSRFCVVFLEKFARSPLHYRLGAKRHPPHKHLPPPPPHSFPLKLHCSHLRVYLQTEPTTPNHPPVTRHTPEPSGERLEGKGKGVGGSSFLRALITGAGAVTSRPVIKRTPQKSLLSPLPNWGALCRQEAISISSPFHVISTPRLPEPHPAKNGPHSHRAPLSFVKVERHNHWTRDDENGIRINAIRNGKAESRSLNSDNNKPSLARTSGGHLFMADGQIG
ncbi:hypothetical protein CEXT_762801 [Caerostris extrusa]|uniref:Uncharacterized protein n=1 Tax=Caerostris extrusa TaxID=172846 RepID=A0AAV4NU55_CAEEX|nr:hypothetical protein CEXT_762801 [Caerostris extrusa]